jgi:hypothetical protein
MRWNPSPGPWVANHAAGVPVGWFLRQSCPGAKCSKRRTDRTHCSRRGHPTLTVAGGRGRLQPEPIITPDLHDGSGRPRHKPIRTQRHARPRPIHRRGVVDRYKYRPRAHKSPRTPLTPVTIGRQ